MEKVQENRLRRVAKRRGYALVKSRSRDPGASDYGGWMIVDAWTNAVVAGEINSPRALSLADVERFLDESGRSEALEIGEQPAIDEGHLILSDNAAAGTMPPRVRGRRISLVQNALLWGHAARRLLTAGKPIETRLAFVALHQCVKLSRDLVDGIGKVALPPDPEARNSLGDVRLLRHREQRLAGFRDEVLHMHDHAEDDRTIELSWTADPPSFSITSTVGRNETNRDTLTRPDFEGILDDLMPWLDQQQSRLLAAVGPTD
jgi:hypothetical protein